jgi:hypothetical protein
MDKKNGKGKRALKDLTPREKHDVRGGSFTEVMTQVKAAWAAAASKPGTLTVGPVTITS